ncbi:FxSxx-COOH system tetratricopeptide repeat protein [Virgisporangium aliadipatigenens]|nr:FxSxx-COOH system tetratricopeptide repeat protein [Virgisporangium aliadipatigenens]
MQAGQGYAAGQHITQYNTWMYTAAVRAPQDVPPPEGAHNLPLASTEFVGRDLDQLDALLGRTRSGVVGQSAAHSQVAVHGLGGIGKTELVLHYARDYRRRFPLVWWINADNADNISEGLTGITTRLQCAVAATHAQQWAIGWLQAHPGWLLVLDNVEEVAHISPLLSQVAGHGHILVTTRRDPSAGEWAALGMEPLRLAQLDRKASVDLLIRLTGNADRSGADAVAEELGDLPLALEQAATYITRRPGMDYRSYQVALAERFGKVSRHGGRDGRTTRTFAEVWQVTMATITEQSPLARRILDVVAWLGPERLPQDVLYPLADDPDRVIDAIELLAAHNMVRRREDHTISTHRLVQAVTRDLQPATTEWPALAVNLLASAAPTQYLRDVDTDRPRWKSFLPHIDACWNAMPAQRRNQALLLLVHNAALYRMNLEQTGAEEAVALLEEVAACYERSLGRTHRSTIRARRHLGEALIRIRRSTEAAARLEEVVADYRRTFGDDHWETLVSRLHLAKTYRASHQVGTAVDLIERVFDDCRRALGDEHLITLWAGRELASVYRTAGRAADALRYRRAAVSQVRKWYGKEHLETLRIRRRLAGDHVAMGKVEEAVLQYKHVVADCRRVLGKDHPETLKAVEELKDASSQRSWWRRWMG